MLDALILPTIYNMKTQKDIEKNINSHGLLNSQSTAQSQWTTVPNWKYSFA